MTRYTTRRPSTHSHLSEGLNPLIIVVAALIIVIGLFLSSSHLFIRETVENAQVRKQERVCDQDQGCRYLIFTDKGVFENTDSLIYGKFNSSDVYGSLDIGGRYTFDTTGFRIPFMSLYPNIVKVTPVGQ